jgi:hypothetical protein
MQIVWDQVVVEKLKNSHTLLELETFDVKGVPVTTWCVVPAEKIGLDGLAQLAGQVEMHQAFIKAFNEGNYSLCEDCLEHLMGKFGGELDSFYDVISAKIKTQ